MRTCSFLLVGLTLLAAPLAARPALQSGPMVGAVNQFATIIWLQTTEAAEVAVRYWPEGDKAAAELSDRVATERATAFVAKCQVGPLQPGQRYVYEVLVDGQVVRPRFAPDAVRKGAIPMRFATPPLWRYREEGHAPFDFTLGFGSCYYRNDADSGQDRLGGTPYGDGFSIFESIYEKAPDAFVWLGDNIY
ncbi:MAG: hypothetical protein ACLFR7_12295, partial [Opitutales bacterium]